MNKKYIDLQSSILYRCNQKYFDRVFAEYGLVYSQFIFLTSIFENEGMMMNELASDGSFDKGTITKSLQKLEDQGFVKIVDSKKDKRAKELYTTQKARDVMGKLYAIRQDWLDYLSSDISDADLEIYHKTLESLVDKAKLYESTMLISESIRFSGLKKLSLSSYPGYTSASVIVSGCNFRCPFCNKKSVVFMDENKSEISVSDVISYINQRKNVLDAICIEGGEPLLQDGLIDFLRLLRKTKLKIKLNSNGTSFERLKEIIDEGLVDYVSLSIKNHKSAYSKSVGISNFKFADIEKSIEYLKNSGIDYDFSIVLVKEFHSLKDIEKMAELLNGAKRIYLDNYVETSNCIEMGLNGFEETELENIKNIFEKYCNTVVLRNGGSVNV